MDLQNLPSQQTDSTTPVTRKPSLRRTTFDDVQHHAQDTTISDQQVPTKAESVDMTDSIRNSGSVQFNYQDSSNYLPHPAIKKTAQILEPSEGGAPQPSSNTYVRRKSAQLSSFSGQRQQSVSIPLQANEESTSSDESDNSVVEAEPSKTPPSLPLGNASGNGGRRKTAGSTMLGSLASFKSALSNGLGRKNVGRSNPSVHSENTLDGQLGVLTKMVKAQWEKFESSYVYRKFNILIESIGFQLTVLGIFHTVVGLSVLMVTEYVLGSELPSIGTYNIVHELCSFQAKLLLGSGWSLTQVIAKAFMAQSMVKSHNGIRLIDITAGRGFINPPTTRTMRWLFGISLLMCVIAIVLMAYEMKWAPVRSSLGAYPCTPVSYPEKPKFLRDLGNFLQGDSNFAQVYMYGLPLSDGIVGGWAAWPLAAPSQSFSVEADGVIFAANAQCADPELAPPANKTDATHFKIYNQELWGDVYLAAITVRMPAGSHEWDEYKDRDIMQKCQVSLMTGTGRVKFGFVVDEWNMATGGQIESLQVGHLLLKQRMPQPAFYGSVAKELKPTSRVFSNLTSWIGEAVGLIYNDTSYVSSQGASFANIHQWATEPDGLYHTSYTARGFMASLGCIAHYVQMQYDGFLEGTCNYYGFAGRGEITSSLWSRRFVDVSIGINLLLQFGLILAWLLLTTNDASIARAVQILDHPLRLLYELKDAASHIISTMKGEDLGEVTLRKHLREVHVKYGEKRSTRGQEVGELALDVPGEVVKFRKGRVYNFSTNC
ncbi:hypothetical protein HDV05_002543 [Chytridiales sp. JEL 0842]|nr:hypothetical protein HDV05_002543 [Chytridiales sp. JEL 0842]